MTSIHEEQVGVHMIYGMIGRQSGWQEDGRPAEHNNDLTDDLIDLLDVKETSDFYSDDLIEDQAGGPLQDHVDQDSGDGYDDDNMLLGIDSCVKREGSVDVLEDDGSQSSDGRDFLDRLEGSNSPERIEVPHKDVGNLRRPNLLLSDEHFGQKQSSSLKKDSHDNSPEARLKPKMVKYDRVDERINEESEELSFNICLGWSELASKLRIGLVRQLKQAAYFYNLQYKDRFEVVRHTMYIEKTKFLFSKMRESRKKLLGYSLSKLKQLKDNTKHEQEKNNLHASYLFSQKQSENSKFSSERRRQMVYKIAGSITSYSII